MGLLPADDFYVVIRGGLECTWWYISVPPTTSSITPRQYYTVRRDLLSVSAALAYFLVAVHQRSQNLDVFFTGEAF